MRLLLSEKSKKELFLLLKDKYNSKSINDLAKKLSISKKTLQGWFYLKKRTIPQNFIDKILLNNLEILEIKEDNWGQKEGGKKVYNSTIQKFGKNEIKRRQSLGGKRASIIKDRIEEKNFFIDIKNPLFLEFYGALLGDGWISHSRDNRWMIGLCGNLSLDKEFIIYLRKNIKKLFNRNGYLTRTPKQNVIEFRFRHKWLLIFLNKDLEFPIGKKINLQMNNKLYTLGFDYVKYIIRGVFDTDGCFYLDKNRKKISVYPCISIHMKSPILIKQIGDILSERGFKFSYSDKGSLICLKGKKQLGIWMKEIGSSNSRNLDKINKFLMHNGLVHL